ncbi:antirestriction protein ArdA [Rothia sp. HMSC08A08]
MASYNAGVLNGRWFPAEDAADVTPADLHRNTDSHEEL